VKSHIDGKSLPRHLVWTLALIAGACSSGGGGSNGGNGGSQSAAGRGGSASAGSGGSGTAGTSGTAGGSGTTGATGGSSAGAGGSAGGGTAGTTGGSSGGAGGGAGGGTGGGTAGANGGAGGRGGTGGGTAGANGGAGGNAGRGGGGGNAAGGRGGSAGGGGQAGGAGGGNQDAGPNDAVAQDAPTMDGGAFIRSSWTATYTCTGTCPMQDTADTKDADTKRAFDGDRGTRWSTGQYQQSAMLMPRFPLYFTVDMKEVVNIARITLDAGTQDTFDAPGQMDVLVSDDGTNYTTVVSAHKPVSPSNGMTDTIMLPAGTVARYIQLKATMTIQQVNKNLGDRFWAIGEMNVFPR
jgi:hypothetical protein